MDLQLIVPTKHIEYTSLLPGRFCIVTEAYRSPEYREYFVAASEQGYKVTLDNGTFEGERIDATTYLKIVGIIKPAVVIAPDTIGANVQENYRQAVGFVSILHAAYKISVRPEVMIVPQCERGVALYEIRQLLGSIIEDDRFQWIGICRDLIHNCFFEYTKSRDQEVARYAFAVWLQAEGLVEKARRAGKKWHFLGVGSAIHLIRYYWFVDTMDTASFFYQATLGQTINYGSIIPAGKRPSDYFRRDFSFGEDDWGEMVAHNCIAAQGYADDATILRNETEGKRL